ncbi:MAG: S-adenosylmethionine:tRNA ribosyltransferase-isomerase [Chitinophagia bacterium]|jgi:S-adenosylmethionine:tRNA ribosyltransferase-isomerase
MDTHNHPRNISIADYQYQLADEKIARFPLPKRDDSKLLIYQQEQIQESYYYHLPNFIPSNTLLIFNDTRVVPARLYMQTSGGNTVEVFCLEPGSGYADISTAMLTTGKVHWQCLIGGAKKWKEGVLSLNHQQGDTHIHLQASLLERKDAIFLLELSWKPEKVSFAEMLSTVGELPLPPYLNRAANPEDYDRYQTVFAQHQGSVAAPTAGLHFTKELLENLKNKSITNAFITLHVGAGTFMPVKAEKIGDHEMHREYIEVSIDFLDTLRKHLPNPVITVGTTSMRTLESIYWLGSKLIEEPGLLPGELQVNQWDPYLQEYQAATPVEAINALLSWMQQHELQQLMATTQLFIAPGYTFQFADALITNFHQPGSTLLLLVSALVGDDWRKIYEYALNHSFRFLSYGDGSLLWRNNGR